MYTLLKHNKLGSFSTQYHRKATSLQAAADLVQHGYKLPHVQGLKQKHIRFLVEHWQAQEWSIDTIKNRLAHLRTLYKLIKKREIVPSSHDLGLGKLHYSTNQDKS